jgi:hypothetical protein
VLFQKEGIPMSQPSPQEGNNHQGLGSQIHTHFAPWGGVELALPDRRDLSQDLQRRARIAELVLQGKWGVELETFEADQERERQRAAENP